MNLVSIFRLFIVLFALPSSMALAQKKNANQLFFLSFREFLELSDNDKREYAQEIQSLLKRLEKTQSKTVKLAEVSDRTSLFSKTHFLSQAYAQNVGDRCLYAGHFSTMERDGARIVCKRPESSNCKRGQVECNPMFFGYNRDYDKGVRIPICVSGGNQAAQRCSEASSKDFSQFSQYYDTTRAPDNERQEQEWNRIYRELQAYCFESVSRSNVDLDSCRNTLTTADDIRARMLLDKEKAGRLESSTCAKFPLFLNRGGTASMTGIQQRYILRQTREKEFAIDLNIKFNGPNHTQKANKCLSEVDSRMLGPNGEKLVIRVNQPPYGRMAPEVPILINNIGRSNSANWDVNASCGTVIHEVLHLLGLCDEYPEQSMGYKVNVTTNENGEPVTQYDRVDSGSEAGLQEYDCRFTGQRDSIMSYHWEALSREGSLLRPAHFNSIVYPDCFTKNFVYNTCARFAYRTTPPEARQRDPSTNSYVRPNDKCSYDNVGATAFNVCNTYAAQADWTSGAEIPTRFLTPFFRRAEDGPTGGTRE